MQRTIHLKSQEPVFGVLVSPDVWFRCHGFVNGGDRKGKTIEHVLSVSEYRKYVIACLVTENCQSVR